MISMSIIPKIFTTFLEFLAPLHCQVCSEYIGDTDHRFTYICDRCADRLPISPNSEVLRSRLFDTFVKDDVSLSDIYSLISIKDNFAYMELIHSLKYYGIKKIGYEFGIELGHRINKKSDNNYNAIIPVPIHHARKRERGYNQSTVIAKGISEVLSVQVNEKLLIRFRYTKTQTLLDSEDRIRNVSAVFRTSERYIEKIKDGTFLLIDDVITTGSTLNNCALALLEAGAKKVDAACLASA
jgi:competence protein ComFC